MSYQVIALNNEIWILPCAQRQIMDRVLESRHWSLSKNRRIPSRWL